MQCFILTASVKSTLVVNSVYIFTKLMEHIIKVNDTGYGACQGSLLCKVAYSYHCCSEMHSSSRLDANFY